MSRTADNGHATYSVSSLDNMDYKPVLEPDCYELICQECDKIKAMLLDKNRKYGNSAINPKRIFSSADPIEQINVRIDDKLSRIAAGQTDDTEDAETDLIGYLILKKVAIAVQCYDSRVKKLESEFEVIRQAPPPSPAPKTTRSINTD
jgi:hypothetical protein